MRVPVFVNPLSTLPSKRPFMRARPMSSILTVPSRSSNKLSGLMSRWITSSAVAAWARPVAVCIMYSRAKAALPAGHFCHQAGQILTGHVFHDQIVDSLLLARIVGATILGWTSWAAASTSR